MWSVDAPTIGVDEIAIACAARVRSRSLGARIRASVTDLVANAGAFASVLENQAVHSTRPADFAVGQLSDKELIDLYSRQVAESRGAARRYYNEIMSAARYRRCSYCQYGQATTLDHYLPKSWISGLALEPQNLIPACQQCNRELLSQRPTSRQQTLFHPYTESVESRWLYAVVVEGADATLRFEARPDADVDEATRERILSQFGVLKLAMMYTAVSASDIQEARNSIRLAGWVRGHADAGAVAEFLRSVADAAFAVDLNSRRGAVYEALAASEWFCAGGFGGEDFP